MFTGIITDLGRVQSVERPPEGAPDDARFVFATGYDTTTIALGASIACSGACLTVVEIAGDSFSVDVSAETLSKTTLGGWRVGTPVNLERSLRVGDELGGHLVYGHVDGLARVVERRPEGGSLRFLFDVSAELSRFIAPKGSIALDGVSLTVNEVSNLRFGVNIIPHTAEVTTFGTLQPGDAVNLEIDTLARYVARLSEAGWTTRQA